MTLLPYTRDSLRYKYFVKESNQHQAKLELRTLQWCIQRYTKPGDTILDPMSGVGSIHLANFMGRHTIAIELVPSFVELQRQNIQFMKEVWTNGNVENFYSAEFDGWDFIARSEQDIATHTILEGDNRRHLPLATLVDATIFSPPYSSLWTYSKSNRESKIAQEKNYQVGYDDSDANVGNLKSHTQYLLAMEIIYKKCYDSMKDGGILVTVVKDYIEKGQRVLCSRDNLARCIAAGFKMHEWHFRDTSVQNNPFSARNKERRVAAGKHHADLDIDKEDIIVVRK